MRKIIKKLLYRLKSNYTTEQLMQTGLQVGDNFLRMHDVLLDPSRCWLITIGNNVTMAPRVHILAHDASTKMLLGYTKIGNVVVGDNVFIGADTVVLPGVTIGNNVIVGANSTVSRSLADGGVYAGSPAKYVCSTEDYKLKNTELMRSAPVYGDEFTLTKQVNNEMKAQMRTDLKNKIGFIR